MDAWTASRDALVDLHCNTKKRMTQRKQRAAKPIGNAVAVIG